jgi:thioredoxin 2
MAESYVHTTCPSCGARNRIPVARLGQSGRCGGCRATLPGNAFHAEWPVEVTDGKFDALTRLSSRPVLVDFWAPWCAPCRQLAPVLEELARELAGKLLVAELNTEEHPATAARFGVRSIPMLVMLRSGLEVDRIVGGLPLAALRQRIQPWLRP